MLSLQGKDSCTGGAGPTGPEEAAHGFAGRQKPCQQLLCVSRGRPNCVRLVPWARMGSSSSQLPFPWESLWA